jgi:hypothetical protein
MLIFFIAKSKNKNNSKNNATSQHLEISEIAGQKQ